VDQATHNKIVSFIWGIADDVLRDLFKRGKYPDVILPMCGGGLELGRGAGLVARPDSCVVPRVQRPARAVRATGPTRAVAAQDVVHFFDSERQPRISKEHGSISLSLPAVPKSGFPQVSTDRFFVDFLAAFFAICASADRTGSYSGSTTFQYFVLSAPWAFSGSFGSG